MTSTLEVPATPSGADIDRAAALALPLFRLNQWTWRGEDTPPTEADLGAQFSSLAWSLDLSRTGKGDGTHFASSGRLMVVRNEFAGSVSYLYSVRV